MHLFRTAEREKSKTDIIDHENIIKDLMHNQQRYCKTNIFKVNITINHIKKNHAYEKTVISV